jgi:hypothetical protein
VKKNVANQGEGLSKTISALSSLLFKFNQEVINEATSLLDEKDEDVVFAKLNELISRNQIDIVSAITNTFMMNVMVSAFHALDENFPEQKEKLSLALSGKAKELEKIMGPGFSLDDLKSILGPKSKKKLN